MQVAPAEPGPPGLAWGGSSGLAGLETGAPHRPLRLEFTLGPSLGGCTLLTCRGPTEKASDDTQSGKQTGPL